jgi:hypothetical protein
MCHMSVAYDFDVTMEMTIWLVSTPEGFHICEREEGPNYIEHICEVGAKILVFSLVLFAFLCIKNIKFYVFLRQKFSVAFFELTLGVYVCVSER